MKNKIRQTNKLAALGVAAMAVVGTGLTAQAQDENPWQFGVVVPLWAPGIDGNVTVKGHQQDVNINFDQLKDHLDASFALGLEARKGKFGIFGDVGYMKFSADGTVAGHAVDSELKFAIANAGVSYLLIKTESEHPFVLEGTLGLRYWYTDTSFSAGGLNYGKDRNLEDPMIGLRGSQYLTQKFHLDFAGDIGGFGISDNQSTLDWSVTGMATYDFAKWFSLSGGYKALALDASSGSGSGKNGVDVVFNGFLIAAKFKF
jgi:hypothetical protein